MVKRKEVTDFLRSGGLRPNGGTRHEMWTDGVHTTFVPRHREISNQLFEKIKKQAGLRK